MARWGFDNQPPVRLVPPFAPPRYPTSTKEQGLRLLRSRPDLVLPTQGPAGRGFAARGRGPPERGSLSSNFGPTMTVCGNSERQLAGLASNNNKAQSIKSFYYHQSFCFFAPLALAIKSFYLPAKFLVSHATSCACKD